MRTFADRVRALAGAITGTTRSLVAAGTAAITAAAEISGLATVPGPKPSSPRPDRRNHRPRVLAQATSRMRRTGPAAEGGPAGALDAGPLPSDRRMAADLDTAPEPLAEAYDEDRIVVLPRDPRAIFVYWNLSRHSMTLRDRAVAERHDPIREVLEIHLLERTGDAPVATDARWRVPLLPRATSRYVDLPQGCVKVEVVLGLEAEDRGLLPLLASSPTDLPPDGPDGGGTTRWHHLRPHGDEARVPTFPSREAREWIMRRSATGAVASSSSVAPGHHVPERDPSDVRTPGS